VLEADVSHIPAPVVNKIANFIRLLSSDKEGEIVAAAHAIVRTLRGVNLDIHSLAEQIGGFSEADMKRLYAAGYDAGARAAENRHQGDFHNIDGTPSWHEMATWCQQHSGRLGTREQEFVNQMAARTVWHEPTERQGKWLLSIFYRLGGKRR
jgi:hypothetical protein